MLFVTILGKTKAHSAKYAMDFPFHGGGWGTGVLPGLQNRVGGMVCRRWVRFPHALATFDKASIITNEKAIISNIVITINIKQLTR